MVSHIKDATSVSASNVESVAGQSKAAVLADGDNYALKIRKPYTIKKQRERWTEEEHQKFIEALKLYGRAWRQIEEHVGSKTAIQIRSHAQKFFTKVARDSSNDVERSFNLVEIPPPRPKKKPLHPYPRKMNSTNAEAMASRQPESFDESVHERENLSQTSVLSTIDSDTEMQRSCLSPDSSATDAHSKKLLLSDNDNEHESNLISKEEEDVSIMKVDSNPRETTLLVDSASIIQRRASFKLFGKTLLVRDAREVSPELVEKSESSLFNSINLDSDIGFVTNRASPSGTPHKNNSGNMDYGFGLPRWTWYKGLVYHHFLSCNLKAAENSDDPLHIEETLNREELQRKGSSSYGSSCVSASGAYTSSHNGETFGSNRASSAKKARAKGFVPYKRCVVERDDESHASFFLEQKGQSTRVCS